MSPERYADFVDSCVDADADLRAEREEEQRFVDALYGALEELPDTVVRGFDEASYR